MNIRKLAGASILVGVFVVLFSLAVSTIGIFGAVMVFGGVITLCGSLVLGVYLLVTSDGDDAVLEEVQL